MDNYDYIYDILLFPTPTLLAIENVKLLFF